MLSFATTVLLAQLTVAAPPATRIAVLLDDPVQGTPASAAIEMELQRQGFEVVAAAVSQKMRRAVAPKELMGNRLPEGLSVFEADAILAGAASYGKPADVEGVKSVPVFLTVRVIDLGTGQATATFRSNGVGVGAGGPMLVGRAADQATSLLFKEKGLSKALKKIGQASGSVTLVVQGLPNRNALTELRGGLEKSLAGAPVKEIYFAKGLGKLVLGGSKARSMVGPDIADIISANRGLALKVEEVANTRIVAAYDRSRTVHVHALVLEPKLPKRNAKKSNELGRYVATQLATFDFARASYQRGRLSRKQAIKRAKKMGADVVVESEILGIDGSSAFQIRIIDVESGKPILRQQKVLAKSGANFDAAQKLIAQLGNDLPEKISALQQTRQASRAPQPPTAQKE